MKDVEGLVGLQVMRMLEHTNVLKLKHCFYSMAKKDEVYLNLVLEFVPETVYKVSKHYDRMHQQMPIIYVQLHTYQDIQIGQRMMTISTVGVPNTIKKLASHKLQSIDFWRQNSVY